MQNRKNLQKLNTPDQALSSIDRNRRPTPEQFAKRRRNVGRVALAVGILTLIGADKLVNLIANADKTSATVTFGSNTNATNAAQAIEALEGMNSPSYEATSSLASDIVNRYEDKYTNAQMTTDMQAGGVETPIIQPGNSVNVPISKGNYPQTTYYDVQAGSLTNHNGPGEIQISFPKSHK